ncbi:unnamed protein product [Sympodiomycopsis kandeliae]
MKFSTIAATVLALATPALSSVYVTNPVASTKVSGGDRITIRWQDSDTAPKVSSWGGINIWLAAGSESSQFKLDQVASDVKTSKTHVKYTVPKDIGPPGKYYFIRFESTDTAPNGTANAMSFSARFNIDSVNGKFNSTVMAAAQGKEGSASSTSAASTATSTGLRTVPSSSASSSAAAGSASSASKNSTSAAATSGADVVFANLPSALGFGAVVAGAVALL